MAKKLSEMRACGCFDKVNKQLAASNTQLEYKQTINFTTCEEGEALFLPTIKIDSKKKGKPRPLFLNFCPFCGTQYGKRQPPTGTQEGERE